MKDIFGFHGTLKNFLRFCKILKDLKDIFGFRRYMNYSLEFHKTLWDLLGFGKTL